MRKHSFVYFLFLALASCLFNRSEKLIPHSKIIIQPFTGASNTEVLNLAEMIRPLYPDVVINPPVNLPGFAFYPARNRYKADSLLKFLSTFAGNGDVVVGITGKDISTSSGTIADWGVMGLGSCPGNSCVASTFRLNNSKISSQLFKVVVHELGHTFGLPHCPNPDCYMRDAKGGNPTDEEKDFCPSCKKYLRRHLWKV